MRFIARDGNYVVGGYTDPPLHRRDSLIPPAIVAHDALIWGWTHRSLSSTPANTGTARSAAAPPRAIHRHPHQLPTRPAARGTGCSAGSLWAGSGRGRQPP